MWTAIATQYVKRTSPAVKTVDAYLLGTVVIGLTMMLYCFAFSPIPYNSFLAAFLNSVGSFVLAANIRQQLTRNERENSAKGLAQRHFFDFVIAQFILNALVAHYI